MACTFDESCNGMENYQQKFLLSLLAYAVQRGIPAKKLCEQSGIDLAALQKQQQLPGPELINSLWKHSAYLTGDQLFGLHFGESMQLAALGVVGQIIQTSNTVGEALSFAGSLTPLITDMFDMKVQPARQQVTIHLLYDKEKAARFPYTFRQMAGYLVSFTVQELDGLMLERIEPITVRLPYSPTDLREYERVLRCPVRRSNGDISLELKKSWLDKPVLTGNYELQQHLLQKVEYLRGGIGNGSLFRHRIQSYLLTNSYMYTLSQEAVASNFNISTRSLQRKLKEEGVTYLEIVDEVRKTLALNYLKSKTCQVKDIAWMLGYNEKSAFIRAFKRWTDQTPSAWQESMNKRKK